jgi:hypothetical protein
MLPILPVSFYFDLNYLVSQNQRQQHTINSSVNEISFAPTTGTSTLRKHLADYHISAWVKGCDKLEVPITAAAIKYQVTQHRLRQGSRQGQQTHFDSGTPQPQAYSEEAFVDALVEWIVADDQVSLEFIVL